MKLNVSHCGGSRVGHDDHGARGLHQGSEEVPVERVVTETVLKEVPVEVVVEKVVEVEMVSCLARRW